MKQETVTAHYFSELAGIIAIRAGQILNMNGYRLDKRVNGKPVYPKDKVDAMVAVYVEGMRPLSELECTMEDLRKLLGDINKRQLYEIINHDKFPKPARLFMKVKGGAPPVKVWLIADILAVDVKTLLAEAKAAPKVKMKTGIDKMPDNFSYTGQALEIIRFIRGDYTAYTVSES